MNMGFRIPVLQCGEQSRFSPGGHALADAVADGGDVCQHRTARALRERH